MPKPAPHQQYRFITHEPMRAWPYSVNDEAIECISTPQEWEQVVAEFDRFFNSGKELNLSGGIILMKMGEAYVLTNDTRHPERIRNRERYRYQLTDGALYSKGKYRFEHKKVIGVQQVTNSLDEVMARFRIDSHLGYETRVVDLWDNGKEVLSLPGFLQYDQWAYRHIQPPSRTRKRLQKGKKRSI